MFIDQTNHFRIKTNENDLKERIFQHQGLFMTKKPVIRDM